MAATTRATAIRAFAALAVGLALILAPIGEARPRTAQHDYLQLATLGIAQAKSAWRDRRRGWYDERLHDRDRYPLVTIWGAAPLFEAIDGVAVAHPTGANRSAVKHFADGAERYFDRALRPQGGYAPYPNLRDPAKTWFDDNGWWGLAFFDAFRATGSARYLRDAKRAFTYTTAAGWDPAGGGLWWNTSHPYKAGEALASNSLLGALIYAQTKEPFYLRTVQRFVGWADSNLWNAHDGLYARSDKAPAPMPYVEGPMIEAYEVLCRATGDAGLCAKAAVLADRAAKRFRSLYMGPQFDAIYLRTMLAYGRYTGDQRWRGLAEAEAARAEANAGDGSGLYLRAWDGSDMSQHQADPGMLRTHAATVSVFAWLAATPSP